MSANQNSKITIHNFPFIPNYKCQRCNNISVYWFERKFCQTLYGADSKCSNACVIITAIIAAKIESKQLPVSTV